MSAAAAAAAAAAAEAAAAAACTFSKNGSSSVKRLSPNSSGVPNLLAVWGLGFGDWCVDAAPTLDGNAIVDLQGESLGTVAGVKLAVWGVGLGCGVGVWGLPVVDNDSASQVTV